MPENQNFHHSLKFKAYRVSTLEIISGVFVSDANAQLSTYREIQLPSNKVKATDNHFLRHVGLLRGYLGHLLELLQRLSKPGEIENLHEYIN